ncbi:MAG TPA: Fe-S protein assembly co-chaperone HscB [Ideonella sp.]|nr:Fe-S protein assembly co-chaperone HscB [Ideonella sp.]
MNLDDDDFTLFGLPQQFALDRPALDERWRGLQGKVHPDKFAAQGGAAQRVAMQWAVRVNEAYRRLKDPLARAAYLCELRGAPVDAENNTAMPAAFLVQQMGWRESLDEAEGVAEVEAIASAVDAEQRSMFANAGRLLDEAGDAPAAAQQVRALMFVNRFQADIARRLEALEN